MLLILDWDGTLADSRLHIVTAMQREIKKALRKLNIQYIGEDFYVDTGGCPQWDEPGRENDSTALLAHAALLLHNVNFNNVHRKLNFPCNTGWHHLLYVCVSQGDRPNTMEVDIHCEDIEEFIADVCA